MSAESEREPLPPEASLPAEPLLIRVEEAVAEGGLRTRLERALRCPFCLDRVSRADCLRCTGTSCGAVYHRECWEEFRQQSATCAILGCESNSVHAVGGLRYWLRFARLLLAGLLFPPRLVRTVRRHQDMGATGAFGLAWASCWRVLRFWWKFWNRSFPGYLLIPFLVIGYVVGWFCLVLTLLTPLLAFVFMLGWSTVRTLSGALRAEINALHRTERPPPAPSPSGKKG